MATATFLRTLLLLLVTAAVAATRAEKLVFQEDFDSFDLRTWEHEITMGGGGNWEFEMYLNNRSMSFVKDSVLYLKPQLTADVIGQQQLESGFTYDIWGQQPANLCTGNAFYGCLRASTGAGTAGHIINPIQSARVRTTRSFSFTYGRVEIRAKLPKGDWLWPAIWMLPTYNQYGQWPASGEIDIVESRGNAQYPTPPGGVNSFSSTLHWGPTAATDAYPKTTATYTLPAGQDFSQDFHVFGLLWNKTHMQTYVDDPANVVLSVEINSSHTFWQRGGFDKTTYHNPWSGPGAGPNAPFDREFYLIFNVAVGGTSGFFPDGVGGKPWVDSSPYTANQFWAAKDQWYPGWNSASSDSSALQVDYVKVYQTQRI